jgi:hypothetical protein
MTMTTRNSLRTVSLTTLIAAALGASLAVNAADKPAAKPAAPSFDSGVISGLGARNIGSAQMSGRIAAIAAVPGKDGKTTLIVGAATGGGWKSTD